ncbi:MAG: tetratricopeptide repeat protein [Acidobacteria bacterium]|nr:tetratricopeptide repeat protein [Acidobacteriota bacterium]
MWVLPSIAVILLAAAPFEAQKIDPLTGKVVEQAPPPEPATADLSEANEKVKAQDYAGAEALLATLQEQFPEDPALLALRGELLVALGRIDEAIPVLQEVAELDPESARVQFQLGTALASNGNRPAAIDAFGKAVDLSEEPRLRFLARMNRSLLFQQQRQWSAAAAELEAALELDPSRSEAWADLATLYLDAEDLDGALAALQKGAAAGHRSARHFYSVGARLYKAERFEEARGVFETVIEIEPTHARAERSLAATLEKLDRSEQALAHWARYLELAPGAPDRDQVTQKLNASRKR